MSGTPRITVIADDLTGALDAAVLFRRCGSVVTLLDPTDLARVSAEVVAIDTAARREDVRTARALAARAVRPADGGTVFKKMDSRLRGHFAAEIDAMLEAGPWRCALVAPALPEQGRAVRGGVLHVGPDAGPSLRDAFAGVRCGSVDLVAVRGAAGAGLRQTLAALLRDGARVVVCDAETAGDLDALVRAAAQVQDRGGWLWCGSAGLAGALARDIGGGAVPEPRRVAMPFLGMIGSPDPVARAQLRAAERCGLRVVTLFSAEEGEPERVLREAETHLREGGGGLFVASPPMAPGAPPAPAPAARLARCAPGLVRAVHPASLILSGGDTAREVCHALGIWGLRVEGELAPGVPLSWALGPAPLREFAVVTKAGSFGSPDLWCRLIFADAPGVATHPGGGTADVH